MFCFVFLPVRTYLPRKNKNASRAHTAPPYRFVVLKPATPAFPGKLLPIPHVRQDHRCVTPPRPPSTALEAHALYVCWESRLPSLRRPHALRLLEAVIANETFASPPPTRFSTLVEKHIFSAWPVPVAGAGAGGAGREGRGPVGGERGTEEVTRGGGGSVSSDGSETKPRPLLCSVPEQDLQLEDALGLTAGSNDSEKEAGFTFVARDGGAAGERGRTVPEPSAGGTAAAEGRRSVGGEYDATIFYGGAGEMVGGGQAGGRARRRPPPPDAQRFSRVYLGLYRNLSEARGVPWGFKSRTTKSTDEGEFFVACPFVCVCVYVHATGLSRCERGVCVVWRVSSSGGARVRPP